MKLVLASQSPRRSQLLSAIGITDFITCPAKGEEVVDPALSPAQLVEALATQKVAEIHKKYPQKLILGADTVVAIQGQILGKPQDQTQAAIMLTQLAGRTHQVFTGVCLRQGDTLRCFHEMTEVTFRPLTPGDILRYIAQGESLDKAGGYGIQSAGSLLVESIQGDYYNVMGLPLCALGKALEEFGFPLWGEEQEG